MLDWLNPLAAQFVENVLGISIKSQLGGVIHFFIYDSIKIAISFIIVTFIISYLQSYLPPERAKKILEKFPTFLGNIIAAIFGVVTPFCSCSSVPIFVGLVETGVPLSVTLSFLITSPIVDAGSIAILLAIFGWKVTLVYIISGVLIGVIGGTILGKLKLEKEVEEYVYKLKSKESFIEKLTQKQRLALAWNDSAELFKKVWLFLIIGIGVGAFIHGYTPNELLIQYAGKENPLAVFAAVIIGVPLYLSTSAMIPIVQALIGKGVALGTALAFMMAVSALSVPEGILLRKVMKPKLLAMFFGITSVSILVTGYMFNIFV